MDMLGLPVLHYVTATIFVIVCILTMLVVLIQKGRGGGLSGAFGGVGGHSAFGAKTGDVFTWITVGLATGFLVLAVWLNYVYVKLPATTGAKAPAVTAPPPVTGGTAPSGPATPATPGAPGAPAPTTPKPAAPTTPKPAAPTPSPAAPTPEKPAQ